MKSKASFILEELKKLGRRETPIRREMVKILLGSKTPLTPAEILNGLNKIGFEANKTTVYRQLQLLRSRGIVNDVQFPDRAKRYEAAEDGHHHHLICLKCGKVKDVNMEDDVDVQEKNIWRKQRFKVLKHSLEFFGFCASCNKKLKKAWK